jgi:hypothetical protein
MRLGRFLGGYRAGGSGVTLKDFVINNVGCLRRAPALRMVENMRDKGLWAGVLA